MQGARFKSTRCRNVVLAVAVVAWLYFAFALLLWGGWVHFGVREGVPLRPIVLGALPALLLFAWFGLTSLAALRHRRLAGWLLAVGLLGSAVVFVYDAATRNYQIRSESYHGGGTEYFYTTWWWYNDAWFRR
jgi:hypothetical protein